jgi:hypothetical protein
MAYEEALGAIENSLESSSKRTGTRRLRRHRMKPDRRALKGIEEMGAGRDGAAERKASRAFSGRPAEAYEQRMAERCGSVVVSWMWEERSFSASAYRPARERRRAARESAWRVELAEREAVSTASRRETERSGSYSRRRRVLAAEDERVGAAGVAVLAQSVRRRTSVRRLRDDLGGVDLVRLGDPEPAGVVADDAGGAVRPEDERLAVHERDRPLGAGRRVLQQVEGAVVEDVAVLVDLDERGALVLGGLPEHVGEPLAVGVHGAPDERGVGAEGQ